MVQDDGTLQHTGGPIEGRAGTLSRTDRQAAADAEIQRQREAVGAMIDDLQATLFDPLSANFPGLAVANHPFTIPDEHGHEWTFTPYSPDQGTKISRLQVDGKREIPFQGKQDGQTVVVNVRAVMDRNSWTPLNSTSFRSEDEGIAFMGDKIQNLLTPIKAAHEAVAGTLPRWSIGEQGERVLTIPPINPQE